MASGQSDQCDQSDKKVAAGKKGSAMSSFLVISAVIAAGGMGRFLWKYQARLDAPTPTPAAFTAQPLPASTDAGAKSTSAAQLTELPPPAAESESAPAPNAVPIPIYAGRPTHNRAIRGDIKIVGRHRTTEAIAPATTDDIGPLNSYANTPSRPAGAGPRVYTSHDPNRDLAPAPTRSGKPRYYDYDSRQSLPDDDSATFQRRTTVRQYR